MQGREVALEHLSFVYITPIDSVLKQFVENKGLQLTSWHHDSTNSHISRNENPFRRSVQISVYEDAHGIFVAFVPELYKEDTENDKRYVCAQIPLTLIRKLYLPTLQLTHSIAAFTAQLENELSAAWENTYFITPDMLKTEIALSRSSK